MNILYLSLKIHKGVVFVERLYPRFIVIHHTAGFDVPALTIDGYHAKQGFGVKITSPKPLVEEYIRRGFRRTDGGVIVCIRPTILSGRRQRGKGAAGFYPGCPLRGE